MKTEPESLLEVLAREREPLGAGEILGRLGWNASRRTELKRRLRELVREGRLVRDGKRWELSDEERAERGELLGGPEPELQAAPTEAPPLVPVQGGRRGRFVIGVLRRHPDGFGFVRPLAGGAEDVYLPVEEARRAVDGDLVRVERVAGSRGRVAGRLIDVIERRRTRAVGTYVVRGRSAFVEPLDRALGAAIEVAASREARDGDRVKVALTRPPSRSSAAAGELLEVFEEGDPESEVLEAAYRQGFSDAFPSDVVHEARSRAQTPHGAEEHAHRRDVRRLRLVTIDGEDARDFDDAVYVEPAGARWRLVVAIADVAHYVRPGHPLDHEALRRGTSVYFPGFALPMLPPELSSDSCSLLPNEDRFCLVADMVLDTSGPGAKVVDTQLYEAVMRSAARCTYTQVQRSLDGDASAAPEPLREDFRRMAQLARRLFVEREGRGAIDFDLPETKVVLDERGMPLRLEKRERLMAHRIVEEFMLAANEAVARHFAARDLPTVYRVHGEPDEEKLEIFLALARAHGFDLQAGEEIEGASLNRLLKRIAGTPEQRTLNFLLLRSMMQAIYSAENVGHFGLAAPFYLHFTSPIRRYPDLVVHRLLKEHWARGARGLEEGERAALEDRLEAISGRASERERAAMAAEREAASFYAALFMKDKVGEEYGGTVCAVTDFGFFVELEGLAVEGLVPMETVGEGGELDLERHRIVFPDGEVFALGNPVRVRVENVNLARRRIDFALVATAGVRRAAASRLRAAGVEAADSGRRRGSGRGRPARGDGRGAAGGAAQRGERSAGGERRGGRSAGGRGGGRGGPRAGGGRGGKGRRGGRRR